MYEDTVVSKSLLNFPLEQIYSSYLFSENKRKIKGLKLLVFPYDAGLFDIKNALDEEQYKVISYLISNFEVKYESEKFYISYYNDEIFFDEDTEFYTENIGYKTIIFLQIYMNILLN